MSDVRKDRKSGRHFIRLSLRLVPERRRLTKVSAMGATPLRKAEKEVPEACWAWEGAEDPRHALPSVGRGCWAAGCTWES